MCIYLGPRMDILQSRKQKLVVASGAECRHYGSIDPVKVLWTARDVYSETVKDVDEGEIFATPQIGRVSLFVIASLLSNHERIGNRFAGWILYNVVGGDCR
jgi:hypothetical protein